MGEVVNIKPEQYYLNTQCTAPELQSKYGLSRYEAEVVMNTALTVVRHQRKLELLITSKEDKKIMYANR